MGDVYKTQVLDLRREARLALGSPHNHEGIVGELFFPEAGGAFQHLGLVGLEEVLGVLLVLRVFEIGEDPLPGVPQGLSLIHIYSRNTDSKLMLCLSPPNKTMEATLCS